MDVKLKTQQAMSDPENVYGPWTVLIAGMILILLLVTILGCGSNLIKSNREGEIKISYTLNAWDLPTVVWLEDGENNYIQTIYVSDWLSNDGFSLSYVCPQWREIANWGDVPEPEVDAVTSATPVIGTHEITVNCDTAGLIDGNYIYAVETHIQNKYNILYKGKITIGDRADSDIAEVMYIPQAHADSTKRNVLSDVRAIYEFKD
jgi:hypothetical protein